MTLERSLNSRTVHLERIILWNYKCNGLIGRFEIQHQKKDHVQIGHFTKYDAENKLCTFKYA